MSDVQCWKCGRFFPPDEMTRQPVISGGSLFTFGGRRGAAANVEQVDLCPACARAEDRDFDDVVRATVLIVGVVLALAGGVIAWALLAR